MNKRLKGQKKEEWREICDLGLSRGTPEDALIFFRPYTIIPFYYYRQKQPSRQMPGYVYPPNFPRTERGKRTGKVPKLNAVFFQELASRHQRVWVVYAHHQGDSRTLRIKSWLVKNFNQAKRWGGYENGIEVVLYSNRRSIVRIK